MKGIAILLIVMLISLGIAFLWDRLPLITEIVHTLLNPTVGKLLDWNINWGMVIITAVISLILTFIQKYTVDNVTLKKMKEEQKKLSQDMKQFKDNPEKLLELQKQMGPLALEMMNISMRPLIFTAIPIILFFRWFADYFAANGNIKIFGFLSWFWAYLILSIIFSLVFRKMMKLP